jgi:glutaredoxin
VALLTLYSRPQCHLCEAARRELLALRDGGYAFELREVDIDSDPDLLRRFLELIPVVSVDGEIVSQLVLDRAAVQARLDTVDL